LTVCTEAGPRMPLPVWPRAMQEVRLDARALEADRRQHDDLFTPDEVQQGRGGWLSVRIALRDSAAGLFCRIYSARPLLGLPVLWDRDLSADGCEPSWVVGVRPGRHRGSDGPGRRRPNTAREKSRRSARGACRCPATTKKPRSSEAWTVRVRQGRSAAAEAAAHPVRPGCGSRCGARLSSRLPRLGSEPVRRAARLPPDPHRACWRA